MAKEITPVLFFGYDDRFIPEKNEPPKHDDTANESVGIQSVRRMDFRPKPIVEQSPAPQIEARDESPKASSATEPVSGSSEGSQTSPSGAVEDPAAAAKVPSLGQPLGPPLL